MRVLGLFVAAIVIAGCGPKASSQNDAGSSSGQQNIQTITGRVIYDPTELQWRGLSPSWTPDASVPCANGELSDGQPPPDGGFTGSFGTDGGALDAGVDPYPPCLAGDTFNVEDAIKALSGLPPLLTLDAGLPASGYYTAPDVNVTNTTLALVGSVSDPSGLLAFSAYGIGKPPFTEADTKGCPIYVASVAFVTQIAAAISSASGMTVSYSDLMSNGVGIVHVVGTDGATGVSGAQLMHSYSNGSGVNLVQVTNNASATPPFYIYYLNDDLTGVNANGQVTSNSGLIVLENAGSAENYTVQCVGSSGTCSGTFPTVLIGSRVGTALETVYEQGVSNPACSALYAPPSP